MNRKLKVCEKCENFDKEFFACNKADYLVVHYNDYFDYEISQSTESFCLRKNEYIQKEVPENCKYLFEQLIVL